MGMRNREFVYGKCPICSKENIFLSKGNMFQLRAPIMEHKCKSCNYVYDKESGYFIGAFYISYGFAVFELILFYIIIQFFTLNLWIIFPFMFLLLVLLSFFNFRNSRIIWISIFNK